MKEEGLKTIRELSKRISSHEATVGDWMDEINIRKIVGPTKVSSSVIRETQSLPEKDRIANIKTIQAVVKTYSTDGQFMVESLIENIHREDLTSMEKAKFIKKIWIEMGKPNNSSLARTLSMDEREGSKFKNRACTITYS